MFIIMAKYRMKKKVFSFLILRGEVVAKDFPDRKLPGGGGGGARSDLFNVT